MGKRLTPEQKARIIAEYTECGNYSAVARKFGVTPNAIKKIVKANPQSAKKCEQKKSELELSMLAFMETRTLKAQGIVDVLLNALRDKKKVEKANLRDTATALGIVVDKFTGNENSEESATAPANAYAGLQADIIGKGYIDVYRDLKTHKHRYYDFRGGRGSLKSTFCALALIDELERNPNFCAIAIRQVKDTLKDSVYAQIVWAIDALGLTEAYKCTVSPLEIKRTATGQKIYFRGADDPLKLKSIRPPKDMYIGVVWIEEADQLHGRAALRNILQSVMRGGDDTIVLRSYNTPVSRNHFINLEALEDRPDRLVHHSYYCDAPKEWLGEPFFAEAEYLKQVNERAYRHEYLGEAVGTGGTVFENVNVRQVTEEEAQGFERYYMGVDWGYYPDPYAWVKAAYDPARRRLYLLDELVVYKQSNQSTARMLKEQKGVTSADMITADSAEPKSIADYRSEGFACYGVKKGRGSIDYSMKWLQGLSEIVIDIAKCPKSAEEFTAYEYEHSKDGEIISGYPDKNNHCIDAVRYGLYPAWKRSGE